MTIIRNALLVGVCVMASTPLLAQQTAVPTRAWALKPLTTPAYKPGLKPWIKLSDLKAAHKGQSDWHDVVVDDGRLVAEYVSAGPSVKVPRRMHPDTREWFAVLEGEVRVEIEGQEAFVQEAGGFSALKNGPAPKEIDMSSVKAWYPNMDDYEKLQESWVSEWNQTFNYRQ